MDPNATFDRIASLLADCETFSQHDYTTMGRAAMARADLGQDLDYACFDLWQWLSSGGFEPDWARHELASSYYRCRAVQHARGIRVSS